MRAEARRVDLVDATRSFGPVADETGGFQDLQVLGDRRPAHRQAAGQFADGAGSARQPFEDRPAGRIGERGKRAWFVSHDLL